MGGGATTATVLAGNGANEGSAEHHPNASAPRDDGPSGALDTGEIVYPGVNAQFNSLVCTAYNIAGGRHRCYMCSVQSMVQCSVYMMIVLAVFGTNYLVTFPLISVISSPTVSRISGLALLL